MRLCEFDAKLIQDKYRDLISSFVAMAILFSISYITNYPSFSAWFLPIDDHEYVQYLGTQNLRISQVPMRLIQTTEVGNWGQSARWRPIYYLIRLLLISTIGDFPGASYFFRASIQAAIAFMAFVACRNVFYRTFHSGIETCLRDIWALVIAICVLGSFSWIEISTRLGPAELELVFGVGLTGLALTKLCAIANTAKNLPRPHFILMILGVVIASGSKENGTFTLIPLVYVMIKERRMLMQSMFNVFLSSIALITPLLVISNIVVVHFRQGESYDGREISILYIWNTFYSHTLTPHFLLILMCIILNYLLWSATKTSFDKVGLVFVLFYFLLNISEAIFYGDLNGPIRYRILSDLSIVMIVGVTLFQVFIYFHRQNKIRTVGTITVFSIFIFTVLVIGAPIQNLKNQHNQSKQTRNSSYSWNKSIDELSDLANKYREMPLVIYQFDSGLDYEMTVSLIRFIKYRSTTNSIYLEIHEPQNDWDSLSRTLTSWSKYGSSNLGISPLLHFPKGVKSICIAFSYSLDNPEITIADEVLTKCKFVRRF